MSNTGNKNVIRWLAVEARDVSAVGQFVYGVRSTGIYCTPACSARTAGPESVGFFDTPEDARRHGSRACEKCDPDQVEWVIAAGRWM